MSKALAIGELARETGVKVPTIRYYESVGLLPSAPRTESNRRQYDVRAVRRLRFVRHARESLRWKPYANYSIWQSSRSVHVPRSTP
jgi:hypothetical protein